MVQNVSLLGGKKMAQVAVKDTDIQAAWTGQISDPALLERCVSICRSYGISAADLSDEWELMQMNSTIKRMTLDVLSQLERRVKEAQGLKTAKMASAKSQIYARPTAASKLTKDSANMLLEGVLGVHAPHRHTTVQHHRPTSHAVLNAFWPESICHGASQMASRRQNARGLPRRPPRCKLR